jgi:hypothetical protein
VTVGRTPWTDDQPCRKAATYTQDNTNAEETREDIHASSRIRTHDPTTWAVSDISFLDRAAIVNDVIFFEHAIIELESVRKQIQFSKRRIFFLNTRWLGKYRNSVIKSLKLILKLHFKRCTRIYKKKHTQSHHLWRATFLETLSKTKFHNAIHCFP